MVCLFFNLLALQKRVITGSVEHIIPIVLALIFSIILIQYSVKKLNLKQQQRYIHYFAVFVSLTVILFHLYYIFMGNYDITKDLPLYLCSLIAILIPIFTYYRSYWMYEILVFWIIAGTLQAVITPDIAEGFPSFDFFRYWIVHLGLLIVIFYATFVFKMQPKFKSVFKSFFAFQLYVLIMIAVNYLLNANYFYLNKKPKSASLLDLFGDWPYYIVVVQLIIIPLFLLIYVPFYWSRKRQNL